MEPTYAQTELIFKWISWKLPRKEAQDAVHWLEKHATRKEVSQEIARLHDLYHGHKLDKETLFKGAIWNDYKTEG